jgi:hypothetical protein
VVSLFPWGQRSRSHEGHYGTRHTVLWSCTHIPNIIDLSRKTKMLWSEQASLRRSGSGRRSRKNQTKTISLFVRRGDIIRIKGTRVNAALGVKPLINSFKVFYKICVFSSLRGHFVWSLTFPTPYVFWNVHDSSTFCQDIMGCLKSCQATENTYSKNSSVIAQKFSIYRSCIKSSIQVLKYN